MFLNKLLSENKKFIEACVDLHQQGKIPANSYVLDLDMLYRNAKQMAEEGGRYGLKVFAMTKQIGRNPAAIRTIMEAGIKEAVCVDMDDARPVYRTGMKIGHLGHLVQVPFAEMQTAVDMEPAYMTVYSHEKAREIEKALQGKREQNVMLRIFGEGDSFYRGHEAGFAADTVLEDIKRLEAAEGIKAAGLTTFPAQLYNAASREVEHTHNYTTLLRTADSLRKAGYGGLEINAPGTTSSMLFGGLAADGVTQVEPGHGLTGTTPAHAYRDLAEGPALAYVSEISHIFGGKPYCFGGGMYIDPVFPDYEVKACVGREGESACRQLVRCEMPAPSAIDYYGILDPDKNQRADIGDTVVFGFRAQIFVTRAYVVPVKGILSGRPEVEGIYLSNGREAGWPL